MSFRKTDGLDTTTQVRLAVYDVRERVTNTSTQLGQATVSCFDWLELSWVRFVWLGFRQVVWVVLHSLGQIELCCLG